MKTAMFLAASAAVLAVASPLNKEKRKIETEVVIEYKTVYVTEGFSPSVFAAAAHHHNPHSTLSPSTPTTPTATPESTVEPVTVAPVPDSTTVVPVPTTSAAPPPPEETAEPTTSEAPAPVNTPAPPAQAPAASTVQDVGAQPTDYQGTAIYHHNIHRLNYSAPAIQWSETYAGYAAQTAAKCKFAHDMTPGGGGYGQNLALWGSTGDIKTKDQDNTIAQAITDMWHNGEVRAYPWSDAGKDNPDMTNFETWGHFSQLVWASSEVVGCASQYCDPGTIYPDMGSWFTVCDYYPPGNMGGGYGKNVLTALNEATVVV